MDSSAHIDAYTNSLKSQGSTSKFPGVPHQTLNQAVGPRAYQNTFRSSPVNSPISTQSELQLANPPQSASHNGHSPLRFSMPLPNGEQESGAGKRKQDGNLGEGPSKRKREGEDADESGAKHWTDEEKGILFNWLMGSGQDEHWNALRAAKNSALRECASEVFDNKKSYQALKGCFERNFDVFRRIYAFQTFSAQLGTIATKTDGDRIREYERRLLDARKNGCDIGNINARMVDQWHRTGWYQLFLSRWEGDPAVYARPVPRKFNRARSDGEPVEGEDDSTSFDPLVTMASNPYHERTPSLSLVTKFQGERDPSPPALNNEPPVVQGSEPAKASKDGLENPPSLALPPGVMKACLQLLQTHCQQSSQKLEFLRKREDREDRESRERREFEKARNEREAAEWDLKKQSADTTMKSKLATDILANPAIDTATKQAAGDYLKRLFS